MDLRRIDALVAERVMGYAAAFDWHSTTDGNDMLAVVERVLSMGYWIRCEITEDGCSARLAPTAARRRLQIQSYLSNTLPLAVSLAALRVVLTPEEFAEVTHG